MLIGRCTRNTAVGNHRDPQQQEQPVVGHIHNDLVASIAFQYVPPDSIVRLAVEHAQGERAQHVRENRDRSLSSGTR